MQCAVRESLPRGVIQVVSTSTRPPLIMCWPRVHKWSMHSGLFPGPLQSPGSPCSSHTHRIYCTNLFPVSWPWSSPRWGVVNCHASLSLRKICRRELGKKHQATHHSFAPTLSSPSSQRSPRLRSLNTGYHVFVSFMWSRSGERERTDRPTLVPRLLQVNWYINQMCTNYSVNVFVLFRNWSLGLIPCQKQAAPICADKRKKSSARFSSSSLLLMWSLS